MVDKYAITLIDLLFQRLPITIKDAELEKVPPFHRDSNPKNIWVIYMTDETCLNYTNLHQFGFTYGKWDLTFNLSYTSW